MSTSNGPSSQDEELDTLLEETGASTVEKLNEALDIDAGLSQIVGD